MKVREYDIEGIGRLSTRNRKRVSGSGNSNAGLRASGTRSSFQYKEVVGYDRESNRMRAGR